MKHRSHLALVFSGGGARGSYQVGAWRAMSETGLAGRIGGVYGTSVGAINAAAFAQGDYRLAEDIWREINYEKVFADLSDQKIDKLTRSEYVRLFRSIVQQGGLQVEPLKKLLREALSEEKIRQSAVDFGLVVYDLTHRKPLYLRKKDIPEGQLIEYVIASATFPLFQPHKIDDTLFWDGGISDNRPMRLLNDKKSVEKVICVDVTIARHFWKNKRPNNDAEVFYLRPSKLLGSPMAFKNQRIRKNMRLGYVDTIAQLREGDVI